MIIALITTFLIGCGEEKADDTASAEETTQEEQVEDTASEPAEEPVEEPEDTASEE